jgi:hypothetical protein
MGNLGEYLIAVGVRVPSEKESAMDSYSWRRRERPDGLKSIVRWVDTKLFGGETWGDASEDNDGEGEDNEGERWEGAAEAKVN